MASFEDGIVSIWYARVSILFFERKRHQMFMKHSISTFACALALGLATGGYADDIKSSSLGVSRECGSVSCSFQPPPC